MAVEDWNHRFYQKINDIRRHCGMPVIHYPCDPVAEENYGGSEAMVRLQKEAQLEAEQGFDGSQRIAVERQQIAEEQQRIADQKLRKQESDRRFYNNLNEIRVHLGMPPIDYLSDSIRSGSTTVIDHGDRPVEVEVIAEPSQEMKLEGPSWNFDDGRLGFSVDELMDRKVEFESVQIGSQEREIAHSDLIPVLHIGMSVDLSEGGCSDPTIAWGIGVGTGQEIRFSSSSQLVGEAPRQELDKRRDEFQTQFEFYKVTFNPLSSSNIGVKAHEMIGIDEYGANLANYDVIEKTVTEFVVNSVEFLDIPSAPKVFEKMFRSVGMTIFDPGGGFDILDYEICEGQSFGMVSTGLVDYKSPINALFYIKCVKDRWFLMSIDRAKAIANSVGCLQWIFVSKDTSFPYDRGRLGVV